MSITVPVRNRDQRAGYDNLAIGSLAGIENIVSGRADFVASATQAYPLGTRGIDETGRVYRYVQAGASDLVAGDVIQSSAIIPNHLANTPPVVAVGATSFSYTPGATAAAANLYADGLLQVDTTPGLGHTYIVASHPAITASVAFTLTLRDPIRVALTGTSRVGLIANPYKDVIQLPVTTATGQIVGVAPYVIPTTQYGWIGTWGTFSVLITGTPALGAMVLGPGTVAGAAQVVVAAGNLVVGQVIGHMAQVGVDGKCNFVHVRINP